MQYCSLWHQNLLLSPVLSTTGCCFCFGSVSFILFGVISSLISSRILGTYRLGEFIFQCPILLPFHTVHRVLKARILKEELPRSVGAQHGTGDQCRNNSRKNEGMGPKQKQYPVVDVTGGRSKVRCCKEQYCIGTWNVRSMNQVN